MQPYYSFIISENTSASMVRIGFPCLCLIKVPSDTVVVTLQFFKINLLNIFFDLRIGQKMYKITNNSM